MFFDQIKEIDTSLRGLKDNLKNIGGAVDSQLDQLDVGHHLGAPPELGEQHRHRHVGEGEAPPLPVPGDAAPRDQAGATIAARRTSHPTSRKEPTTGSFFHSRQAFWLRPAKTIVPSVSPISSPGSTPAMNSAAMLTLPPAASE